MIINFFMLKCAINDKTFLFTGIDVTKVLDRIEEIMHMLKPDTYLDFSIFKCSVALDELYDFFVEIGLDKEVASEAYADLNEEAGKLN